MCAIVNTVVAGNPVRLTWNVAVADETLPDESFWNVSVMVAVPLPAVSVPAAAGTSFVGDSVAVNVAVCDAPVVLLLQAGTPARTSARRRVEARDDMSWTFLP